MHLVTSEREIQFEVVELVTSNHITYIMYNNIYILLYTYKLMRVWPTGPCVQALFEIAINKLSILYVLI